MKHLYVALGSALVVVCAASAQAAPAARVAKAKAATPKLAASADFRPKFEATPSWVDRQATPQPNPERKEDPFEFLLTNSQEFLSPAGLENYVEYVVSPHTQAGLQAFGNIILPWNVYRTDFTLHHVDIERDGQVIKALNEEQVSVIQRETKLEQATLTGLRTVLMPVKGLRVGDRLRVAFSYKTKPNYLGKPEEIQDLSPGVPVRRMFKRFVVSKDLPVRWSNPDGVKVVTKDTASTTERTIVAENIKPAKERKFVPGRLAKSLYQVSSYTGWNEIADRMKPLFDEARKTAPDSAVAQLADKIAATHKDPRSQLIAALRESQDQVRYVALLLGDGDYKPMTADEVWDQRYGDCKGKTAFLLALLDRLKIAAEPMLASVNFDDGLNQRLPSLAILDHVYVRAQIGSETFYLDGTQFGQRTLEELKQAPTRYGVPIVPGAALAANPDVLPGSALTESNIVWDLRNGVTAEAPFEAVLTLRGPIAAQMRTDAANSTDREKFIKGLKDKVPGISNDLLEFVSSDPETADGSYVARFKGKASLDWSPVEGLKGNRLQLGQSTVSWDGEFDRDDDEGKAIPVVMAFPYWERSVEKVLLPNGGKDFVLDAPSINETVAVTNITRTVVMADGAVVATNDFKRLGRELDAPAARAAKGPLKKVSENYAYVVSKKKLKLPVD